VKNPTVDAEVSSMTEKAIEDMKQQLEETAMTKRILDLYGTIW